MGEKNEIKTAVEETKVEKKTESRVAVSDKKGKKKGEKKPNIFVRFGRKCKEVFSELKKVTWPTFGKVVKNTGVVLAVVAIFMVVITLFDSALLEGVKALLRIDSSSSSAMIISALLGL